MTNLYLLKSKCSKESDDAGDTIIDLDKLTSIQFIKKSANRFCICISINNDNLYANFDKKEDLICVLKDVLSKVNGDTSLADIIKINDLSNKKEIMKDKLDKLIENL